MRLVRKVLQTLPRPVRKAVIVVTGFSLILLGLVLIVLPGPFTIPPILAGVAVLATEFHWAHRVFAQVETRWLIFKSWLQRSRGKTVSGQTKTVKN